MKTTKEKQLISWIITIPVIAVLLTSFILTNIFISSVKDNHEIEIENIKNRHLLNLKNKIQERIEHISLLLNNNYKFQMQTSKKSIQNIVEIGTDLLTNIYENNKNLSNEEIFKKIDKKMKDIRFFKNNSGYYFIYDLTSGKSISLPSHPQLVGRPLHNLEDKYGKNLFDSFGKILEEKGEGFDQWYWNKPGEIQKKKKIGYIKKFKPLNIAIGTAIYEEDIISEISINIKNFISDLKYNDNSYIFIFNQNGVAIEHKNKNYVNKDVESLDKKHQQIIKRILQKANNNKNGEFLEYLYPKNSFENEKHLAKKISFVKNIEVLNWVIGTGLYTDELQLILKHKENSLNKKLTKDIKTIIIVSLIATTMIVILLILISNKIKRLFEFYAFELDKNNKELKKLNESLESKIKKEVKTNREKDKLLFQQSKMASMGEMLGNIAHQWRQPLSSISTAASGILIQKDYGNLNDEHLNYSLKAIVKNTKVLSDTIDDFRNFFKKDKEFKTVLVQKIIDKTLQLVEANLKNKNVNIIQNIENIEIYTLENELTQSILNIVNNAKDALIHNKDVKHKFIFINAYEKDETIVINIKDNAGGIKEKYLDKVFEPYFTTKHQSNGTGIGLFMTHEIITKNLHAILSVENETYRFNYVEYTGASFTVELPKYKKD